MDNLKRFFEPIKSHVRPYIRSIIESFIIFGFDIYAIILLQYVTKAIQGNDINLIINYLIIFILSYVVFSTLKRYTRDHGRVLLGKLNEKALYDTYFNKLLLADNTAVEKIGTGRLMAIINKGIDTRRATLEGVARFVPEILISIGFVVFTMSQLHRIYAAIFFIAILLTSGITNRINHYVIEKRTAAKEAEVALSRHNVRLIMSKQEVLQSNQSEHEIDSYGDGIETKYYHYSQTNRFLRRMYEIPIGVSQLLVIFIIAYVIVSMRGNYFDYSLFVGLIGARGYASKAIIKFTGRFKEFSRDFVHIEKLRKSFDELPSIQGYYEGKDFNYKKGDIALEHIQFSYSTMHPIFSDFNCLISGGHKVALVGPSGGGKSTFLKLLAGYIAPDQGDIIIDNQNLSTVSLQSYYKHIGYLTQEPSVFDGTIRENLLYGTNNMNIDDSQLEKVIIQSKCERIYDFRDGLDAEIGERGVRLSGGQKQRLAIAKVMLKNPHIILLDEPTSALDSYNEEQVTQALNNLFQNKTVIVIAHRLQTVKHADDIIFIDNGQIIERGNHKQLLALKGEYFKMVELQSGF